jgi:hypothetical protein
LRIHDGVDVSLDVCTIDVARTRLTDKPPRIRKTLRTFTREDPFRATTKTLPNVCTKSFGLKPTHEDFGPFTHTIRPFVLIDAVPSSIDLPKTNLAAGILGTAMPDSSSSFQTAIREAGTEETIDKRHVRRTSSNSSVD